MDLVEHVSCKLVDSCNNFAEEPLDCRGLEYETSYRTRLGKSLMRGRMRVVPGKLGACIFQPQMIDSTHPILVTRPNVRVLVRFGHKPDLLVVWGIQ